MNVLAIGKRLGLLLAAIAAYSVAAEWLVRRLDLRIPDWGSAAGMINTIILGLLMSFRNRAAYERGGKPAGCGASSRTTAEISRPRSPPSCRPRRRPPPAWAKRWLALPSHSSATSAASGPACETSAGSNRKLTSRPMCPCTSRSACTPPWLSGSGPASLTTPRSGFWTRTYASAQRLRRCEKIRYTPLSPSYKSLLRTGLVVNVLAGPWLTAPDFGVWGVPLFELICFFLLGVEMIDSEVEEPFGRGRDDLDLDAYCRTIRDGVASSLTLN